MANATYDTPFIVALEISKSKSCHSTPFLPACKYTYSVSACYVLTAQQVPAAPVLCSGVRTMCVASYPSLSAGHTLRIFGEKYQGSYNIILFLAL